MQLNSYVYFNFRF